MTLLYRHNIYKKYITSQYYTFSSSSSVKLVINSYFFNGYYVVFYGGQKAGKIINITELKIVNFLVVIFLELFLNFMIHLSSEHLSSDWNLFFAISG